MNLALGKDCRLEKKKPDGSIKSPARYDKLTGKTRFNRK